MDLIMLNILEFNVILGMDWLATYHATLNFHMKMVKFDLLGEPTFIAQGDRSLVPYNIFSMLSMWKMLKKGCKGFLTLVIDVKAKRARLKGKLVVNEFIDFFLVIA